MDNVNGFIGEIRMFAGYYAPAGWAFCDGQVIPISQNFALFSLLGTTYGGDGDTSFRLPDMRGRVPLHVGGSIGPGLSKRGLGDIPGIETVTLNIENLPPHRHDGTAGAAAKTTDRPSAGMAPAPGGSYGPVGSGTGMAATQSVGEGTPIENMQPSLGINFIISLSGIFPVQS